MTLSSQNKLGITLILAIILMMPSVYLPSGHSQEVQTPPPGFFQHNANATGVLPTMPPDFNSPSSTINSAISQKAIAFMSDVAGLDMAKYTTQAGTMNLSTLSGGIPNAEIVKYTLSSAESKMDVVLIFREGTIVWCKLYPTEGLPLYAQSQPNALNAANNILDNYLSYSQASYIPAFKNMLNSASQLQNITDIAENIVQQVSVNVSTISVQWAYTVNNIPDNSKVVSMTVQNGGLVFFQDNWNFFTIGNANVNVSRDEAIQIAEQRAQLYSYTEGGGNQTVSNFTFSDQPAFASLSMQDRGNGTLYPSWDILLPLDKVYPDGVTSIQVLEWADNGQITFIAPVGSGGSASNGQAPNNNASITQSPPSTNEYTTIGIIAAIAAISLSAGYLFYKRRR